MRRWLFLVHRWLGLVGCAFITIWFATGFVMMYIPYPDLLESERLERLAPIDFDSLHANPAAALRQATKAYPNATVERLKLIQGPDGPVHAVKLSNAPWQGVDGRTGALLHVNASMAMRSAQAFSGAEALRAQAIDYDQWSMQSGLDVHRPLWVVDMQDGGRHYVSSRTGEVIRDTSAHERAWNWVGSVIHWIYPTVLRREARVWHWVVVVVSSYTLFVAITGTVIGLLRLRPCSARVSPYTGWMRLHHLAGLAAAVFVLAWLFSGLLSMNPGGIFDEGSVPPQWNLAWHGAPLSAQPVMRALEEAMPTERAVTAGAKEVEWSTEPKPSALRAVVAQGFNRSTLWQVRADGWSAIEVEPADLQRRLALLPIPAIWLQQVEVQRVPERDLYHYARFENARPAWRFKLADEHRTWIHIDAQTGELLSRQTASTRVQRWLYHGLHSWDFALLWKSRPLWDLLMLPALALGLVFSITSVAVASRRLARRCPRAAQGGRRRDSAHFAD